MGWAPTVTTAFAHGGSTAETLCASITFTVAVTLAVVSILFQRTSTVAVFRVPVFTITREARALRLARAMFTRTSVGASLTLSSVVVLCTSVAVRSRETTLTFTSLPVRATPQTSHQRSSCFASGIGSVDLSFNAAFMGTAYRFRTGTFSLGETNILCSTMLTSGSTRSTERRTLQSLRLGARGTLFAVSTIETDIARTLSRVLRTCTFTTASLGGLTTETGVAWISLTTAHGSSGTV